jgi:hypothetical protein
MTAPTVMTPSISGANTNSVILTNFPGIKSHASATFLITLAVPGGSGGFVPISGNCVAISFFVGANSGNAYPQGDQFVDTGQGNRTTDVKCDGILKCPSSASTVPGLTSYTEISGANTTTLSRNENKDGSSCVPVPFDVTFSNADRRVDFYWDEASQPYAVLQSTTAWPPELVGPLGLPKPTIYSLDGGTTTYIAPTCLSSSAPAPYGAIVSDSESTTVQIDTATPPAVGTLVPLPPTPFPILVASTSGAPERMLVQSYTGPVSGVITATVIRATGGTTQSLHTPGQAVESTPSPVSADAENGQVGTQVPVCIVNESSATQPYGTAGCPAQPAGANDSTQPLLGCIKVNSTLFMIKDIMISR